MPGVVYKGTNSVNEIATMEMINPVCFFPGEESIEEAFAMAKEASLYEDQREEGGGYDI